MNLTPAKLASLKENAEGILAECRRKLLRDMPFTGNVLMSQNIVPVRDNRIPTACTDGKNIYFSIGFLASLKPDERTFVLAHEVWHSIMAHMAREAKRDHDISNQAEDVEVNEILKAEGLVCPKDACTCATLNLPTGMSFEEYYEILVGRKQRNNNFNDNQSGEGDGDGNKSGHAPSGGNADGSLGGQFDKHIHKGDDMEADEGDPNATDKYGSIGRDEDYAPAVDENIAEKMRETVISAAQQVERTRGELPGHLKSLVNKLLTPQIDWKETLASFISKAQGEGHTNWNMPNKRLYASGIYMPSKVGDKVKVGVMLDVSGSCTQDLQKFMTEVNGIVKSFGNYDLHIAQCDWEVQDFQTYGEDRPLDLENEEYECHGGGGTRLIPGLQSFEQHDADVDCIVAFSDCECEEIPENIVDVPVLWVCTEKGEHKNIKCGTIVPFKV